MTAEVGTSAPDSVRLRQQAAMWWLNEHRQGREISGVQLGERFGRSDRWGRDVIREAKEALDAERQEAPARDRRGLPPGVSPLSDQPVDSVAKAMVAQRQQVAGRQSSPAAVPPDAWRPEAAPSGNGNGSRERNGNGSAGTAPAERQASSGTPDAERKPRAEPQRQPERNAEARQPRPAAVPERQSEPAAAAAAVPEPEEVGTLPGAKLWARGGFLLGAAFSVGANVLQAWLPVVLKPLPAGIAAMPEGWTPPLVEQLFAGFWPLALMVSVEALAKVKWQAGTQYKVARYGGVVAVALFSAVISYKHLYEVLSAFGYGVTAFAGPLVVDGLMLLCGFGLLSISEERKRNRKDRK